MKNPRFGGLFLALAGAVLLIMSEWAGAEPPSRAARLGYITGTVSFSPAGEDDWLRAVVNRPLTSGDRLWVEDGARAELQVGGAAIRLGSRTDLALLNLDDRIVQLQLTQGTLKLRVRSLWRGQTFEVATPNLAFTITRPGEYRISVDANDDATTVFVRSGQGEAYGERASYAIRAQQGYRFYGSGLSDYDRLGAWRDDDMDSWSRERDRRYDNSPSARYVSVDVVGYEDLDTYGSWRRDPEYGNVWAPTRVSAGWTPYRDGHWAWIDPWGWTWVDDAPWGYAVSHYGRWANRSGTWVWVPGPRTQQAVYAPALVAFVGGPNASVSIAIGGAAAVIGWFPLAPREVYQPSYQVSRGYFDRINRSNAVIAPTTITNVYNTTIVNKTVVNNVYVNQRVQGAMVAVPSQAFRQSQPIAKAAVPVSREAAASARPAPVAAVAPEKQSVHGGAPAASGKPPGRERRVVTHTAPPPPPAAFAAQQPALAATPGKPVDDAQRGRMKPAPAAAASQPAVTTVQAPAPTAPPPAVAPAARTPEARRADAARGEGRGEAKGDGRRGEAAKADASKNDAAKADAAKVDAAKADAAKGEAMKAEAAKAAAAKGEAARAEAAKAEAAKGDAMKAEAAKAAAARNEAARAEAAKAEAARAEAAKGDAMKADAAKAAAARNEAARADAAKADAARAEAAKADAARRDAAKAEAAKTDAARAEAAKAEAGKAAAARAAADKAAADKAAADRAAAEKAGADRAAAEKAAAAKADSARAEAKAAREKARAMRTDAEKADDDRKKGAN